MTRIARRPLAYVALVLAASLGACADATAPAADENAPSFDTGNCETQGSGNRC